ncbi:elongation of very long chain fatty acids protein-like [Penaeus chinensis]|uniref:elongation of very long chain fatty acids protein-like n=1 Tax=Penaeus chinensis TaxID=139456 RepID=UPI001FB70A12|nr:elongation of very long chain fatty acids protein-like [Penaeus chinensis]
MSASGPLEARSSAQKPETEEKSQSRRKQDESEEELFSNGIWAAVICVLSYTYGDMTVANSFPKDKRQNSWLLMLSPIPTFVLSLAYVAFVTWIGPKYMRNREPIKGLKTLMLLYNAFQVALSGWIFLESGMAGWFGKYNLVCEPCDFSNNPRALRMLNAAYWYYFSKFVDFMDTIFFVAHKKYAHISLLHVVHHATMPISMWYGVRFHPGGHNTFAGFLNALVHTVMYTYYLLAALGPIAKPFLWWKKYVTSMQMVQFVLMVLHSMTAMTVECSVPTPIVRWVGIMAVVFLVLFTDFYIKAYRKRDSQKKLSGAHDHSNGSLKPSQNGLCFPALNGEVGATTLLPEALPAKELPKDLPRDMSVRSRVRGEAGESH